MRGAIRAVACVSSFLISSMVCGQVISAQGRAHWFTPVPAAGQRLTGAESGAVGLSLNKISSGFQVQVVTPKSPGDRAGLRPGDVLLSVDGRSLTDVDADALGTTIANATPGSQLAITFTRDGTEQRTSFTVAALASLDPAQAKNHLGVGQIIFDRHGAAITVLGQAEDRHFVTVSIRFENWNGTPFQVDDAKCFVLDGDGHQLRRWTVEEMKYSVQLWMAQNQRGAEYHLPPPPPHPTSYAIDGHENGTYRLISPGMVTGDSIQTYTIQPDMNDPQFQMAQAAYGLGSLLLSIRRYDDRKYNEKLYAAGKAELNNLEQTYFRADSPIITGENREGSISYSSIGEAKPPFRVVLFLPNPATEKEESVTFSFQ